MADDALTSKLSWGLGDGSSWFGGDFFFVWVLSVGVVFPGGVFPFEEISSDKFTSGVIPLFSRDSFSDFNFSTSNNVPSILISTKENSNSILPENNYIPEEFAGRLEELDIPEEFADSPEELDIPEELDDIPEEELDLSGFEDIREEKLDDMGRLKEKPLIDKDNKKP